MNKHDKRLDSLRGLFLVVMTINHFGLLNKITSQPFGYVSAAEGFIFLSGYFFALIHTKYIKTPKILIYKSMGRAWVVYKYYFITVIILFLLYLNLPIYQEAWGKWFFPNHSNPYQFILYELLLLHQPMYMDILPMYIIFILFTPFVLIQLNRGNLIFILITVISIWLAGQYFHFIGEIINLLQLSTKRGFFNIFSWQLIWFIGVYIGYTKSLNIEIRLPKTRIFFFTALASAIILLLYRHDILEFEKHLIWSLSKKQNLQIFRLLNFLLMLYLTWFVTRNMPANKGIPWLQFIGRYSIQVFSFQILLLFLLSPLLSYIQKSNYIINTTFTFLVVASLTIPAYITDRYKKSRSI